MSRDAWLQSWSLSDHSTGPTAWPTYIIDEEKTEESRTRFRERRATQGKFQSTEELRGSGQSASPVGGCWRYSRAGLAPRRLPRVGGAPTGHMTVVGPGSSPD